MKNTNSLRSPFSTFKQLCQLIPPHLVSRIAKETGADKKARTFSPWSHVVSMIFAQLTSAVGLHDVCDALNHHRKNLAAIRGATPPRKNTLSHANKVRPVLMAEKLFWETLAHLEKLQPAFGLQRKRKGLPRRFKKTIYAIDSSTIALIARCMDWAKHRTRKAAAKLHLRMSVWDMLPRCAIVSSAKGHDDTRAQELCADIRAGEIAVFDKAYVDFSHLFHLNERGVWWVTRAKDNMAYRVVKRFQKKKKGPILRDDLIVLKTEKTRAQYPKRLRRVETEVEVNGKWVVMVFITNNMDWAASSVADLYRSRWSIEVFFKQIKQVLKLQGFLGNSANGVGWQIWTALLLYVLLRYQECLSRWSHSFTRLFTLLRGVIWDRLKLNELLESYGTAGGHLPPIRAPVIAYLPGFEP